MRTLTGIVLQIVAIIFLVEARLTFELSDIFTLVYISIGTVLFSFGHFLLHDRKEAS